MKYYKFITKENLGPYSNFDYTEYLPKGKRKGKWLPAIEDELETCKIGYHACKPDQLLEWCNAKLYEVEYKDEPVEDSEDSDKVNGNQIRFVKQIKTWNEKSARLFAVWCAREALKLIDEPDPRSVDACDVAERYANGKATDDELSAARAAAMYAAWGVAWAAARDAARYVAWDAAYSAALDAARYVAWAAAGDAAWDAAYSAALDAQYKKLHEMLEI